MEAESTYARKDAVSSHDLLGTRVHFGEIPRVVMMTCGIHVHILSPNYNFGSDF
jgi:hypothetical protein